MRRAGQEPRAITDVGRLQSKLTRPQNAYHYEGITDVFHLAALLAVSISQAQAFEDGNKRTAAMSLTVSLRANGFRLKPRGTAVGQWLISISEAADTEREGLTEDFAAWLRELHYSAT
jgi:death-on-curing family protein